MSKKLTFLLPMGGLGSRFAEAGFSLPKPLIPVDGIPMFQKALRSFSNTTDNIDIVCVIRQEHVDAFQLDHAIQLIEPRAKIVIIPKLTEGAAETAYLAKDVIDPESVLIIMDCDLAITSKEYNKKLQELLTNNTPHIDGLLAVFESQSPKYSYAKTNQTGSVIETAEKEVISPWAIAGAYCFATASTFFTYAEKLMRLPISDPCPPEAHLVTAVRKEYYISYIFSLLITDKKIIETAKIDIYHSFGTPEELDQYNNEKIA